MIVICFLTAFAAFVAFGLASIQSDPANKFDDLRKKSLKEANFFAALPPQ